MRPARPAIAGLCVASLACTPAWPQGLVISNDDAPASAPRASAERQAASARLAAQGAEGRAIHSVRVLGRWAAGLALPYRPCEPLQAERTFALMEAVRAATRPPAWLSQTAGASGRVQVLYIDVDVNAAPAGACEGRPAVDLVFKPYRVEIASGQVGDNVLPLARQALGTAFSEVPPALLALQPALSLRHDPASGTAWRLDLAIPGDAAMRGLAAEAGLQHAFDGPYRDDHVALTWTRPLGGTLAEARLRLGSRLLRQPMGDGTVEQRTGDVGVGVTLRLAATRRLWLDAAHESRREQAAAAPGMPSSSHDTRAGTGSARVLLDWLQAESLTSLRSGLWFERSQGRSRSAWMLAGAREVRWSSAGLIGLEGALVGGRAEAAAPEPQRFRGGAPAAQWLIDRPGAPTLLAMPDGPVLRSAGRLQAELGPPGAARGGTRFWSLGLSAALPVARWSRPLIPDETTDLQIDPDKPPLTLKQLLMRQVDVTGPNLLAATLTAQGVPPEEAQRQAQAALAEVRPAVRYIVEDAPLLAIRPMLMLDTASLSDGTGRADSRARWTALGAGVQVQMATARAEAGVMRTVSGPAAGRSRSALVLRLAFQNLF